MTQVSIFALNQKRASATPWQVRWRVAGRDHSKQFAKKSTAETFRSRLVMARADGVLFNSGTGLPVDEAQAAWDQARKCTVYGLTLEYLGQNWRDWSGKTRSSAIEVVAEAVLHLTDTPIPANLNEPIRRWLRNMGPKAPRVEVRAALEDDRLAHQWLVEHSLTLDRLDGSAIESLLNRYAYRRDGRLAKPNTLRRRSTQFHALTRFGVRAGWLPTDPFDTARWKAPKGGQAVDPAAVPSPHDVERLLRAVANGQRSGPALVAFYATAFYAGLRIAEIRALRTEDLRLPDEGWGTITLRRSYTSPGTAYTDDGAAGQHGPLKRRDPGQVRVVPIPPQLVWHLRRHLRAHPAVDGWVFTNARGKLWDNSRISRVWSRAKNEVVAPDNPLRACRPYDLRHGNASMLLNAGVPATEVAARLGHSVDVLLTTYAHVLPGDRERANGLVDAYLAG